MTWIYGPLLFLFIASSVSAKEISPKVDVELARFSGEFDMEAIRRLFNSQKSKLEQCKSSQPSLDFGVEFQIDLKGKARAVVNHGFPAPSDKAVECVNTVINQMQFPIPESDSTDWIMLPIKYEEIAPKALSKNKSVATSPSRNAPQESESDKINQEYLNRVKSDALKEMQAQNAKQNLILKAKLSCTDQYRKDNLMEKYDRCMADAQYGGSQAALAVSDSAKSCHKTCEAQRLNLEVKCQSCSGNHINRNNCITACNRNIDSQINQCKSSCR
jgi:hypothetical protein